MTAAPQEVSVWKDKRTRQHALYPRQREALQFYAEGLKYSEIADRMGLAIGTARSYVGACVEALGAEDPTDAVRIAIERGEIEEPASNS